MHRLNRLNQIFIPNNSVYMLPNKLILCFMFLTIKMRPIVRYLYVNQILHKHTFTHVMETRKEAGEQMKIEDTVSLII